MTVTTTGSVLVVDDDAVNRTMLTHLLERDGHGVTIAGDGQAALEVLRRTPVDVVLLDIVMPGMDGYAVLGRMKADDDLRDLPVIVISGVDETDAVVRCIELGADDHLAKPCDPVLLRARIGAGLARKRLRDLEREYIEEVSRVAAAAGAVEAGTFDAASLDGVAVRDDALGQLARVFRRMAAEVQARERALRDQVDQLRIEIDRSRTSRRVAEIADTEYFQDLRRRAADLRLGTADDRTDGES